MIPSLLLLGLGFCVISLELEPTALEGTNKPQDHILQGQDS